MRACCLSYWLARDPLCTGLVRFGQVAVAWADPRPIDAAAVIVEAVRPTGHVAYRAPRAKTEHVWIHSTQTFQWGDEPALTFALDQGDGASGEGRDGKRAKGKGTVSLLRHPSLRSACARKIKAKNAPRQQVFKFPKRINSPAALGVPSVQGGGNSNAVGRVDHVPKYVAAKAPRRCVAADDTQEVAALMYYAELDKVYTSKDM